MKEQEIVSIIRNVLATSERIVKQLRAEKKATGDYNEVATYGNNMKKPTIMLIITAVLAVALIHTSMCDTQTEIFRTTGFAYRYKTDTGWTKWSDWQDSNLRLTFNYKEGMVTIYSKQMQIYRVYDEVSDDADEKGRKEIKMKFIDQDGDTGMMRMSFSSNGKAQLYIIYADILWAYNVSVAPTPFVKIFQWNLVPQKSLTANFMERFANLRGEIWRFSTRNLRSKFQGFTNH